MYSRDSACQPMRQRVEVKKIATNISAGKKFIFNRKRGIKVKRKYLPLGLMLLKANLKRGIKVKRKYLPLRLRLLKANLKKGKFSFSNTRWQGGGSMPHPGHRREPAIQPVKYNLQGG